MTHSPPVLTSRAPRIRTTEHTPAVLRFPSGDCVTGRLEVFSSTGGLLCLQKPVIRGTRIKVMFLTENGPVLGAAEMLTPVSWTQQPFRFVTLAHGDQRRLRAITGCSARPEVPTLERTLPTSSAETDWIDKYRAAMNCDPPRKRLLEKMLDALKPGSK